MSAVRVSLAGSWAYMPMQDMASGRMLSESGPLFPDSDLKKMPDIEHIMSLSGKAIQIKGGKLSFGHADGCMSYNGFLDMSYVRSGDNGMPLSLVEPDDGDIMIAVFPDAVMPTKIAKEGHRMVLEFPDEIPAGMRCFVVSEDGKLAAASYESAGGDRIRMAPRMALVSWLYHADPSVIQSKYDVVGGGDGFVVVNTSNGKQYTGRLPGGDASEIQSISHSLAMHGLAGIIPNYSLRVLKEAAHGEDNSQQNGLLE